jgi:hypothetical protein
LHFAFVDDLRRFSGGAAERHDVSAARNWTFSNLKDSNHNYAVITDDLPMIRSLLFATILAFSAAAAAAHPCTIAQSSDLFRPLIAPETAGRAEWRASSRAAYQLMRACPSGPVDAESRRLFFRFIDQQFSLDYDHLQTVWAQQGEPLSEGGLEAVHYFRRDLLEYLDKIVTPADETAAPILLRHARGAALAKLGNGVKGQVIALAQSKRVSKRWAERDEQVAAIDALGQWLLSSAVSDADKRQFVAVIERALPPADDVPGGRVQAVAVAAIRALGNSSSAEVQQKLVAWADDYAKVNGADNDVANAAKDAVNAIARRR